MQKGQISVQTENIFPIIKKFLYSDQEIFLRELIANAVDATTKLKTISMRGELKGEIGSTLIEIINDKENKTLTIRDRGIGMTEEEVMKYLNQVAFSSAQEFLEKYQDENAIIGHFGLGFYSAFMVADRVEVRTKSWKPKSKAVCWTCEGEPEYTLEDIDKEDRGTEIVLHLSEDALEYNEDDRINGLLNKYCKFLPVEIKFGTNTETVPAEEEGGESTTIETDNIINNPNPIWKKQPSELGAEDYKGFYNELYPYSAAPLFWIHLNIDYPFNLTGILYFPKVTNNIESQKNKIQLYCNQVYVTDNVKEIVPDFLTLLHGVIDSPDIPLNVSRSYLQSDQNVKKITSYITKKVADKLEDMFKKDREDFIEKWSGMNVFVKYGMLTEDKFFDRGLKFCLLENTEKEYFTLEEYKEKIKPLQTDKDGKLIVLYTNNPQEHHTYIDSAKNQGYDVLVLEQLIDNHYLQQLEQKGQEVSFARVDADTVDNLIQKDEARESVLSETEQEKVKTIFEEHITTQGATIALKALSPEDLPVIITKPEFMRRMKEMSALNGMDMGSLPEQYNVVINTNHPLIGDKMLKMRKAEKKAEFATHLYNLARLNQNMLKGSELTSFIKKSIDWLS